MRSNAKCVVKVKCHRALKKEQVLQDIVSLSAATGASAKIKSFTCEENGSRKEHANEKEAK